MLCDSRARAAATTTTRARDLLCVWPSGRVVARARDLRGAGGVSTCASPGRGGRVRVCAALTLCSALPPDCIRINCTASKSASISHNHLLILFFFLFPMLCLHSSESNLSFKKCVFECVCVPVGHFSADRDVWNESLS